jgi:hypothetical protein
MPAGTTIVPAGTTIRGGGAIPARDRAAPRRCSMNWWISPR